MADFEVRITDLPGANPLGGVELIPVVQNGETKTRSAQNIVSEAGLGDHIANSDPHPQYAFRVKNNLSATRDPGVNDDSSQGYEPTSRWVNTVTSEFFICVSDSVGNADWQQATLTLDELGSAAMVDTGAGNGLDADLLDGEHGSYYRAWANVTGKPNPTITIDGDANGSVTLNSITDGTLTLTIVDDSHNHTISNVDGLQTTLNTKVESVNGKDSNDIVLVTDDISEDTSPENLWYTDERARNSISVSGDLSYNSTTGVISYNETYSTPSELLTAIKTVDGSGSGLDADLLDGEHGSYYRNASNLNSGTISDTRLPNAISSDITGNAATATKLATARDITLGGDLSGSASFDGSGDITITASLDGLGGSTIPVGLITLWSGATTSIPSGWTLCDGTNGTPDLRNRFVVGAGDTYAVDDTGGSADAVVVSHSHTASTNSAGSHNHSGSTNTTGWHTHTIRTTHTGGNNSLWHTDTDNAATGANANLTTRSGVINSGGSHNHSLSINSNGSHSHSVSVNSSGESGTNKNLPPYYALAYIMKT